MNAGAGTAPSGAIRLAAITDEFSPDLDTALPAMAAAGLTGAELRLLGTKNVLDVTDQELGRARQVVERHGLSIISIASPLLKCVLPDAPPLDARVQHDVFGSKHTFDDQPRLTRRAFEVAERTGATIIRVFSYWRTSSPEACRDRVVTALRALADEAQARGLTIGIENEHGCNVGTAVETARVLDALPHPALGVIWDPANAYVLGESPFPQGYAALPAARIIHVHAKDCRMENGAPVWGPLGDMDVDWRGQVRALQADGYRGYISLETHWKGSGDSVAASSICAARLRQMLNG